MACVYVVDDDPIIRKSLKRWLENANHRVRTADNGASALKLIAETPPDLVLLDVFMPEADGIETLLALKRRNPPVKVIIMSAGAGTGQHCYLEASLRLGADSTLRKPFSRQKLLEEIGVVLQSDAPVLSPESEPGQ